MLTNLSQKRPVIITAADQAYARTLWQFLRSAERFHVGHSFRWLVYDLGLSLEWRDRLTRSFPFITMRTFDFAAYPPHVALARRSYAWKPIIVNEVLDEFEVPVLWLDSATILKSDLGDAFTLMKKHGVLTLKGKPALGDHCDPRVLKALDVSSELLHLPERVAGVVGFDPSHAVARDICSAWARHAMIESHIMPPDAMQNHKPEQAVLSALLYTAEAKGLITLNQDEVDISSGRPIGWLSTRNKVRAWVPRMADPLVRLYYGSWKAGDQFNHRFREWERQRIGGAERRYREHYSVSVQRGEGAPVSMGSPEAGYYADPFPLTVDGRQYLLLEEFSYATARGHLVCVRLGHDLEKKSVQRLNIEGDHLSFPYVFGYGGVTYLVPETCYARAIDLYAMGAEPHQWQLKRRLLYGIDAADTVIIRQNSRWWLITSVQDEGAANRHLEIYWTDDLLKGDLKPHPVNSRKLYQHAAFGTGRNAGNYLKTAAGLIRPMQNSASHYGQGMKLMLIKQLDAEHFAEEPYEGKTEYSDVVDTLSPHHCASADTLLCWDVRDLAR